MELVEDGRVYLFRWSSGHRSQPIGISWVGGGYYSNTGRKKEEQRRGKKQWEKKQWDKKGPVRIGRMGACVIGVIGG